MGGRNIMVKKGIILFLFIFFLVSTNVHANEKRDLRIGGSYDYPPYSFIDENARENGFCVDLSQAVFEVTGRNVEFQLQPFGIARASLHSHSTDIIHDVIYSDERSRLYDFSAPYFISSYIIFKKESAPDITDFKDLEGKKIIVVDGDYGHDYLNNSNISTDVKYVKDYSEAILFLEKGDYEYTMMDRLVGLYWIRALKAKRVGETGIAPMTIKYCFAALKSADTDLMLEINGALSILKENGEYNRIYSRWMDIAVERKISLADILRYGLFVIIPALAIVFLAFLWTWTLKKKVREKTEELNYVSFHDQLTGVYNRRFFEEELKRLDARRNLPITLLLADLNGLKLINDSFGHSTGDEFLKKTAAVLKKACRADDIIARLGGDEFVVLLPSTKYDDAQKIIKRMQDIAINERVGTIDISISMGIATKHNEDEDINKVLQKAEDHMYKKKLFESPSMRGKTINTIISTLHEKNKREEQHSQRVGELCRSIGEAMGLSIEQCKELKNAGLLHDIGKVAVDDHALNKKGKLTDEEWEQIKRHPEVGYRILSTVNNMSEIAEYVLGHHERPDGKGYPKGLTDKEISLQAKIIAIADAYDAMTGFRTYRRILTEKEAAEEIIKNSGTQFDIEIARLFVEKVLKKV
jgi:diguanylate cyclase (GGDEF)-like protein